MIKLSELFKNQKSEEIKVDFVVKTGNEVVATVKDKYRCEIISTATESGWYMDTPVKVYCSCPDLQFRWAYVLDKHKALLHPEQFVLEPPKEKNPGMKTGACKHLAAVAKKLVEEMK